VEGSGGWVKEMWQGLEKPEAWIGTGNPQRDNTFRGKGAHQGTKSGELIRRWGEKRGGDKGWLDGVISFRQESSDGQTGEQAP